MENPRAFGHADFIVKAMRLHGGRAKITSTHIEAWDIEEIEATPELAKKLGSYKCWQGEVNSSLLQLALRHNLILQEGDEAILNEEMASKFEAWWTWQREQIEISLRNYRASRELSYDFEINGRHERARWYRD